MREAPSWNVVLNLFQKHPDKAFTLRELTGKLGLRSSQGRGLKGLLKALVHQKSVLRLKKSRYRYAPPGKELRARAPSDRKKSPPAQPRSDLIRGRLVTHRDGYGFVIPDAPLKDSDQDIYIGARSMGSAMHGDRVEVVRSSPGSTGRVQGKIVEVVDRFQKTVVGEFRQGHPENFVFPFEQRLPRITIPRGKELPSEETSPPSRDRQFGGESEGKGKRASLSRPRSVAELEGMVVDVELTQFPRSGTAPRGRVVQVLGRREDFGVDVEIMIRKHHLPHRFGAETLEEVEKISGRINPEDRGGRKDFRDLPIVTIDGETAKDFDDAVYVERLGEKRYRLDVHVADVGHYVRPGTAVDREARLRGTSVYFPDRAVPMLPLELSNGICSLNPKVDRLVLSASMEIDAEGTIRRYELATGVIHSAARMTYTDVQAVLDGDGGARRRYRKMAGRFELMKELALVLNAKRERRGSIDFDLPEPEIEFDEQGRMVGITRSERLMAHRIIEEFMLAANEAVAGYLSQFAMGLLYRIHEQPEVKKVLEFEEVAATFGYTLGIALPAARRLDVGRRSGRDRQRRVHYELKEGDLDITPFHYQRLTQRIAGRPEERIVSYLMLRSLKQARYSATNVGHFALAARNYTHFTSPIRRYPDLVVHRILKDALQRAGGHATGPLKDPPAGGEKEDHGRRSRRKKPPQKGTRESARAKPKEPFSLKELRALASETSETERRAQGAERDLMEWKKAAFMEERLGDEFEALIISLFRYGFAVELLDLFIEGVVPISTLPGERYVYRERDRVVVGDRGRRAFHLGDRVRVRLDRIDRLTNKLEFSVVDE